MNTVTNALPDSPLSAWISHDDCQDDFRARLVRETASSNELEETLQVLDRLMLNQARTLQTSELVQAPFEHDCEPRSESESMESDTLPALTRGNSIASIASRTSTDMASVVDGGCVLETDDGILTVPARLLANADLLCPFQILECSETFSDIIDFKVHVFSHFRGYPLPEFAPCFICGRLFEQSPGDDNALAWNNLLNHMAHEHYRGIEARVRLRPEMMVMRYMWNRGVISDAEFSRTQLVASETRVSSSNATGSRLRPVPEVPMPPTEAPVPPEIRQYNQSVGSHNEPYTANAGRRQDRRQLDRLRARVRRGNL